MDIVLIIAGVVFAACIVTIAIINSSVKFSRYEICSEKIPESFDGYRITVLSDIHDSFRHTDRIIERIKSTEPDIIMLAGDIHNRERDNGKACDFWRKAVSVAKVYSAEGNHDDHSSEARECLLNCGVVNLTGQKEYLSRNSRTVCISGAPYGEENCCEGESGSYNIWLIHDPSYFDCTDKVPDLMISGHVHGGFLRLPFIGGVFAPGSGASILKRLSPKLMFPKYDMGLYERNGQTLAVSTGYGNSVVHFRLLRPEIMVLTLRKGQKAEKHR